MIYTFRFRRNNKEKYWEVQKGKTLTDFRWILERVLNDTKTNKLEIVMEKISE